MKRKLLSLSVALMAAVTLNAQVNVLVSAPLETITGNQISITALNAPNGFPVHDHLRAHFIITAAELAGLPNGVLTEIGFALFDGMSGSADGNLQVYLENTTDVTNTKSATWATAISSMTSVYNGVYNLPATPTVQNVEVDFVTNGSFIYNGGSVYVAYDYTAANTGATFPPRYFANIDIVDGVKLDTTTATGGAPTTLGILSNSRPKMRFQVANPNANDMTVDGVRPLFGHANSIYQATSGAFGFVTNTGNATLTNVDVTLTVTGANPFTTTQTIASIDAGAVDVVTFTGIPTTNAGTNTYTVTVDPDDVLTNNSATTDQIVSCSIHSYAPVAPITGFVGYGAGQGCITIALDVPASTVPAYVKSVIPTISDNAASAGNAIKGLLFNSAGSIIDSTAAYTIAAGDLTNQVTLEFLNGEVDYAGQSLFIGIRQTANAAAPYLPLATNEQLVTLPNTYYTIPVNGGAATAQTTFGDFLIDAELSFGEVTVTSNADANGDFCSASPVDLTASPAGLDSYDFTIGGSSAQNTASNTYSYSPTAASTFSVTGDVNGCTATSGSTTINPVTTLTGSASDNICTGASFAFGTQVLTAGGTYNETFTSVGGCDSVVTLTLNEITIDPAVTVSGATLISAYAGPGITHQWVDCDNGNAPIAGATSPNYTPTADQGIVGNYAVIITQGNCSDISACTVIDFTSVSEANGATLSVFPSPTTNILNINTNLTEVNGYTIYDIEGRVILNEVMLDNANLSTIAVDALEAGTYIIEVKSSDASARKVFVKN